MKITIPITLLEPLTIPWELMVSGEVGTVNRVWASLRNFLDGLREGGRHPGTVHAVEMSFRVLAKKAGGIDVTCGHNKIVDDDSGKCFGYVYHVSYKTHKDGPPLVARLHTRRKVPV